MTMYVCVDPAWRTCAFTLILVEKEEKEKPCILATRVFDITGKLEKFKKKFKREWLREYIDRLRINLDEIWNSTSTDISYTKKVAIVEKSLDKNKSTDNADLGIIVGAIATTLYNHCAEVHLVRNMDCRRFLKTLDGKDLRAPDRSARKARSIHYAREQIETFTFQNHLDALSIQIIDHTADTILLFKYFIQSTKQ